MPPKKQAPGQLSMSLGVVARVTLPEQEKVAAKQKSRHPRVSHATAEPARRFLRETGMWLRGECGELCLDALVRDNPLEVLAIAEVISSRKDEGKWAPLGDEWFASELRRLHEETPPKPQKEKWVGSADVPPAPEWFGPEQQSVSPAWWNPAWDHLYREVDPVLRAPVKAWWERLRQQHAERQAT